MTTACTEGRHHGGPPARHEGPSPTVKDPEMIPHGWAGIAQPFERFRTSRPNIVG
jgi:hypothetical protein